MRRRSTAICVQNVRKRISLKSNGWQNWKISFFGRTRWKNNSVLEPSLVFEKRSVFLRILCSRPRLCGSGVFRTISLCILKNVAKGSLHVIFSFWVGANFWSLNNEATASKSGLSFIQKRAEDSYEAAAFSRHDLLLPIIHFRDLSSILATSWHRKKTLDKPVWLLRLYFLVNKHFNKVSSFYRVLEISLHPSANLKLSEQNTPFHSISLSLLGKGSGWKTSSCPKTVIIQAKQSSLKGHWEEISLHIWPSLETCSSLKIKQTKWQWCIPDKAFKTGGNGHWIWVLISHSGLMFQSVHQINRIWPSPFVLIVHYDPVYIPIFSIWFGNKIPHVGLSITMKRSSTRFRYETKQHPFCSHQCAYIFFRSIWKNFCMIYAKRTTIRNCPSFLWTVFLIERHTLATILSLREDIKQIAVECNPSGILQRSELQCTHCLGIQQVEPNQTERRDKLFSNFTTNKWVPSAVKFDFISVKTTCTKIKSMLVSAEVCWIAAQNAPPSPSWLNYILSKCS